MYSIEQHNPLKMSTHSLCNQQITLCFIEADLTELLRLMKITTSKIGDKWIEEDAQLSN